ncbi:SURF1 family protein [Pseudoluteimonas lycopersici]|nr:SURF1 family protein [Lysobacter lycopersici]
MPQWLGWTLALLVAAGFARLGFWQLARMHEKEAMLASVQAVLTQRVPKPLSLAADSSRADDFDWSAGRGRFAEAPSVLLDNQSRDERPGVRAYRLFVPESGVPMLVELGWLPLSGDRAMPQVASIMGDAEMRGLLLSPPSPGLVAATANRTPNGEILATALDASNLPALLGIAKLPPRVLRLDPAMKDIGYARDLDVLPNTLPPSRHLGYAVQWFALSLAVLATAAVLTFRKPRA